MRHLVKPGLTGWAQIHQPLGGASVRDSIEKLQNNPVVHYHLAMAYYKNGNKELARKEINAALKINQTFDGAEEAKNTLKKL